MKTSVTISFRPAPDVREMLERASFNPAHVEESRRNRTATINEALRAYLRKCGHGKERAA